MSGATLRAVMALLWSELRAIRREPSVLLILLLAVLAGVGVSFLDPRLPVWEDLVDEGSAEVERAPKVSCEPGEEDHNAVALLGEVPAWLDWHQPTVGAAEADVRVHFSGSDPVEILIEPVTDDVAGKQVRTCLWDRIREERRRRLDVLGITEMVGHVAHAEGLPRVQEPEPPAIGSLSISGLTMFFMAFLAAISWATDALPKARRSGWLETLWSTAAPRRATWIAWTVMCGVMGLAAAILAAGATLVMGGEVPWSTALTAPMVAAIMAVVSMWSLRQAPDLRSGGLIGAGLSMGLFLGGFLAYGVGVGLGPWAAALVPGGGMALAAADALPLGPTLAAFAVSGLAAAALYLRSLRGLEADSDAGAYDRVAIRRASGDYRPEAFLLALIAIAGLVEAGAILVDYPVAAVVVGQLLFIALPALVAPRLLSLDTGALLRLRAPGRRAWLLAPVVLVGAIGTGQLAVALQASFLPDSSPMLEDYALTMEALWASGGLLVLSILPGVCEELLFRGTVLGLLRQRGRLWVAVLVQAVLFGVLHIYAFKLLPTISLGLLFGVLAVRAGSVWPGVLIHAANNALLLGLMSAGVDPTEVPLPVLVVVSGVGFAAAWLSGDER